MANPYGSRQTVKLSLTTKERDTLLAVLKAGKRYLELDQLFDADYRSKAAITDAIIRRLEGEL